MRSGFVGNYVVASDGSLVDVFVTLLLERSIFGRLAGNNLVDEPGMPYSLLISRNTTEGAREVS